MATSTEGAPEAAGATGAFWGWPVGTETGTAVRGTGLAAGTTTTPSFPRGKITPVGNYKETKTHVSKSPKAS